MSPDGSRQNFLPPVKSNSKPYVFLSFSSRDQRHVRELMAALKDQGIDFWDYSELNEAIECGLDIDNRLLQEIQVCDYFLALVSRSSVDPIRGRFTNMEVAFAIERGLLDKGRILPLVVVADPPTGWSGEYVHLKSLRHSKLDSEQVRDFEQTLALLCRTMHTPYLPRLQPHSRLPFWESFRREVFSLAHSNYDHVELMVLLSEFNRRYYEHNWNEALFLIRHFVDSCRYHIPNYQPFYPLIVKGVCEQHLDLTGEAERSYRKAVVVRPKDPDALGGLASVYFHCSDYRRAKEYFELALQSCPASQNTDEVINYVVSLLQLGEPVPAAYRELVISLTPESHASDVWPSIVHVQADLYFHAGDYRKAEKLYQQLRQINAATTDSAIFHCRALRERGQLFNAIQILNEVISKELHLNHVAIRRYLADCLIEYGQVSEALAQYEDHILGSGDKSRTDIVNCARILQRLGRLSRMRTLLREFVIKQPLGLPRTSEDFYYEGFMQHLLGNESRADYDYERSGSFEKPYIEQN